MRVHQIMRISYNKIGNQRDEIVFPLKIFVSNYSLLITLLITQFSLSQFYKILFKNKQPSLNEVLF